MQGERDEMPTAGAPTIWRTMDGAAMRAPASRIRASRQPMGAARPAPSFAPPGARQAARRSVPPTHGLRRAGHRLSATVVPSEPKLLAAFRHAPPARTVLRD